MKILFIKDALRSLITLQKPIYILSFYAEDKPWKILYKKDNNTYNSDVELLMKFVTQFNISGVILSIEDLYVSNKL
jgi:hypothetical protein